MQNKKEILQRAIDTYGKNAIIDLFFEESAELTKALLKERRYGTEHGRLEDIFDEIADVTICLEYLKKIFNCEFEVADHIDFKLERTAQRVAEINSGLGWKERMFRFFHRR